MGMARRGAVAGGQQGVEKAAKGRGRGAREGKPGGWDEELKLG